ncbi:MAG: hypothetical protein CSB48_14170 [Proteobacteria bacterium]|nr:MAG: hypothetical protein CSB48_14170 [Pseudomonadota bacterium]
MGVFAVFGYLLLINQEVLKQALLAYFFPQSWQSPSERLFLFFYESQSKQVLGNLILSSSLVVASIFLFPLKEIYSAVTEKELNYPNGKPHEFPLWMQAMEETRLFFFYAATQLGILWIGYYPYEWANVLSVVLSYLFLFYTFGLDTISPTLQRHRLRYSKINKLLGKNLVATLVFGVMYSAPALALSQWILHMESSLSLLEVSTILFAFNLTFIAISIPAGTRIASELLQEAPDVAPVNPSVARRVYIAMFFLLVTELVLHTRLVQSMHHKSQVLKANYSVNFGSFGFDYISADESIENKTKNLVSFDMEVENPSRFDIVFEDSRLFIKKDDRLVSDVAITGFAVPAGETRLVTLVFNSQSDFSGATLGSIRHIFSGWDMELHLQLFPGIPFIVEVMTAEDEDE